MGITEILFYIIAAVVLGSAAFCAFSGNIVRSAFALLGTFLGMAGLYVFLSADFLAAIQTMVYVGGILILLLFAVMLTSQISDVTITNRSVGRVVGFAVVAALVGLLGFIALRTPWPSAQVTFEPTTGPIGDALLTEYVLPFEIISVLLVGALVAAVTLVRKEEK